MRVERIGEVVGRWIEFFGDQGVLRGAESCGASLFWKLCFPPHGDGERMGGAYWCISHDDVSRSRADCDYDIAASSIQFFYMEVRRL
jgi:hypothetical protein